MIGTIIKIICKIHFNSELLYKRAEFIKLVSKDDRKI